MVGLVADILSIDTGEIQMVCSGVGERFWAKGGQIPVGRRCRAAPILGNRAPAGRKRKRFILDVKCRGLDIWQLLPTRVTIWPPLPGNVVDTTQVRPSLCFFTRASACQSMALKLEQPRTKREHLCAQGLKVRNVIALTSIIDPGGPGTAKGEVLPVCRTGTNRLNHK